MARNQRKYNTEYKVQAVKLSNEIGSSKAAVELRIPIDTLYGWVKAAKEGRLDIGGGAHTPQTAMSLAEELNSKATLEVVGRDQPDQRLYLSKDQESLVWVLDHAENELWKTASRPGTGSRSKIVSADNRGMGRQSHRAGLRSDSNGYGGKSAHQTSECECQPLAGRTSGKV